MQRKAQRTEAAASFAAAAALRSFSRSALSRARMIAASLHTQSMHVQAAHRQFKACHWSKHATGQSMQLTRVRADQSVQLTRTQLAQVVMTQVHGSMNQVPVSLPSRLRSSTCPPPLGCRSGLRLACQTCAGLRSRVCTRRAGLSLPICARNHPSHTPAIGANGPVGRRRPPCVFVVERQVLEPQVDHPRSPAGISRCDHLAAILQRLHQLADRG